MTSRREFLTQSAAGLVALASPSMGRATQVEAAAVEISLSTRAVPRTDLKVSKLAYGTGMTDTSWLDPQFKSKAMQAIRDACGNGITFFDLADTYGHGQSESALGEVLKASPGMRNRIVIQSKCGQVLSPKWSPEDPGQPSGVDTSREHILSAVEGSLRRLGVDHLDILLLHRPDPAMRPEEVAQAFDELQRGGKVRYFGVSNHEPAQIDLLQRHLRQPLVVNQIWVGLGHYAAAVETVDYCRQRQIQLEAYSPFRVRTKKGDNFFEGSLLRPAPDSPPAFTAVTEALVDLAKKKDTNASAIALAWLLQHPAGIVPIIGSSKRKYIEENCAADRVTLSHSEWAQLTQLAAQIQ